MIPTSNIIRVSVKKKPQNKRDYDKKAKPLPPLVVGDSIRGKIRPQSSPLWTQGNVVRRETDRSYVIKADGREYRRNSCHIRKTRELTTPKSSVPDSTLEIPADPVTPSDQKFKQTPPALQPESSADPGVDNNETGTLSGYSKSEVHSNPTGAVPIQQSLRRSQRQVKPNSKYKDFVLWK